MRYLIIAVLCSFSFSMKAQDVVQFKVRKDSINPVGIWVVTNEGNPLDSLNICEFTRDQNFYEFYITESFEFERRKLGSWQVLSDTLQMTYESEIIEGNFGNDGGEVMMRFIISKDEIDLILAPVVQTEFFPDKIRMSPYTSTNSP